MTKPSNVRETENYSTFVYEPDDTFVHEPDDTFVHEPDDTFVHEPDDTFVYDDDDDQIHWNDSEDGGGKEDSLNSNIAIANNLHNTIIPVQPITRLCSRCSNITCEKECTLQCFKCKCFVHYVCSRLPGYMLYLLKTTEFFYVCECCVDAPHEYSTYEDSITVDNMDNNMQKKLIDDINSSLHGLSNSVDCLRTSIPAKSEDLQKSVGKLESKISDLEKSIDEKLSCWRDVDKEGTEELNDHATANDTMQQTITSQESEINLLEVMLADKNLFIGKLIEENKELLVEITYQEEELSNSVDEMNKHKREVEVGQAYIEKLKVMINKLKQHVKSLQGQDNMRIIDKDKDIKVYELYEKLRDASEIIPRTHEEICRLQSSVKILEELLQQARSNQHHIKLFQSNSGPDEDVVIVHDKLFKYVPNNLETLSIRKIFAPTLDVAYSAYLNY